MSNTTFNTKDAEKAFGSFTSYTNDDMEKTLKNEGRIKGIVKNNGALAKFADDVRVYFNMLRDTFSGRYKSLPFGTIAAIVGSLLYVFSPVDLVPDFIPLAGFLDDAAVLAACVRFTKYDLDKYKEWKSKTENK